MWIAVEYTTGHPGLSNTSECEFVCTSSKRDQGDEKPEATEEELIVRVLHGRQSLSPQRATETQWMSVLWREHAL